MQGITLLPADPIPELGEHVAGSRTPALLMMQLHTVIDTGERRIAHHRLLPHSRIATVTLIVLRRAVGLPAAPPSRRLPINSRNGYRGRKEQSPVTVGKSG
ncbi:hypothetical protein ACIBTV_21230 [Micromonospora sp. NPDC049366]|uniref:hypothetical protein n=1 Tax=Micromonospora sp. NPDC049366 TaxID=3364271 RepID=UPI0037ACF068